MNNFSSILPRRNVIYSSCLFVVILNFSTNLTADPNLSGIVKSQDISTLEPIISTENRSVREGDYEIVQGFCYTTNNVPVNQGMITVELFNNNDQPIKSDIFRVNSEGIFQLILNYTSLAIGIYHWEIEINASGYQGWTYEIPAQISSHLYEFKIDIPNELIRGEDFHIAVQVSYSEHRSLSLSEFFPKSGPVQGLNVLLAIEYVTLDSTLVNLTLTSSTDEFGVAIFIINGSQTQYIKEIISLQVSVEGSENNVQQEAHYILEELTVIDSSKPLFGEVLVDNILIILFVLTTILLVILRVRKVLKKGMNEAEWKEHSEGDLYPQYED